MTERIVTLKLTRAENLALLAVADYGLAALREFNLVSHTGTTERAIDALRRGGELKFTRTEAPALLDAIDKGFAAVRAFGLPAEVALAQRAEERLTALSL